MNAAIGQRLWISWLLVLLAALALRLHVAPLAHSPDEGVYLQHAWNLAHGNLDLNDSSWYIHRIPVYAPTSLLYALFGMHNWTTLAWPLVVSLLQILLAMLITRRLAGAAASVFAGLLLTLLPVDVISSVHLHPDGSFGMLMSCSVVSWWLARRDESTRPKVSMLVVSGIALALAALERPYAGILGLWFLIDLWLDRRTWRDLLALAAGAIPVVLGYLAIYQVATGNPLFRLEVVSRTYSEGDLAEPARLLFYPREALRPGGPFASVGLLAIASAAFLARRPERQFVRLILWIAIIAGFLQFGSMSFDSWMPILKRSRFLTPLAVAVCVLSALALSRLGGPPDGRARVRPGTLRFATGAAALALVALAAIPHLEGLKKAEGPRFEAYAQAAQLILERPELPVYADHWRTAIQLGPHVRFFGGRGFYFTDEDDLRMVAGNYDSAGRLAYLTEATASEPADGALILIDRSDGRGVEPASPIQLLPMDVRIETLLADAGLELYLATPSTWRAYP